MKVVREGERERGGGREGGGGERSLLQLSFWCVLGGVLHSTY